MRLFLHIIHHLVSRMDDTCDSYLSYYRRRQTSSTVHAHSRSNLIVHISGWIRAFSIHVDATSQLHRKEQNIIHSFYSGRTTFHLLVKQAYQTLQFFE